jgi:hypothetical protein
MGYSQKDNFFDAAKSALFFYCYALRWKRV